ncbi:MAG TPA: type IVB secretion system protein IcmH/DotU [Caulobacteraceae bacterium]|nr:type IVB secretion system protein IcmH/DotU [Caulobacteraceae bacterium]
MSSDDNSHNSNRTVFRPSPLSGLRGRPNEPGATQYPPGGHPPQGQPGFPPQPPQQQPFPPPPPAAQPFPPPPPAGQPFTPPPQAAPQPFPPAQPFAQQPDYAPPPTPGLAPVAQTAQPLNDDDIPRPSTPPKVRNVMMDQGAAVLALAASLKSGRVQVPLPHFHGQATNAIAQFERAIASAGYAEEQRMRAKYALCATIDDIAQNLPGQAADGAEWARRSMTVHFFSENIGGDRFWQLVDDMLSRPAQNGDLIELYHACLAAGFEGRFRVMPDGHRRLDDIMSRLYAALEHVRSLSQVELSPHWRGQPTPRGRLGFWAPIILAAGAALALLFLIYLILRLILMQTGDPASNALRAINPGEPLRLSRAAAPPVAAPSTQLQTLQTFLAPEIAQHLVVVLEDATTVRVRTTVGELFKSGSDQLNPGHEPLFVRIGKAIETQPGPVQIEGDADSDKVATLTFPDNIALSKARADTVAAIIKAQLSDSSRVTTEGLGDSQPIASNDTPAGKAQNRRVEIVVQRHQ